MFSGKEVARARILSNFDQDVVMPTTLVLFTLLGGQASSKISAFSPISTKML
jgi:hypothetical protein